MKDFLLYLIEKLVDDKKQIKVEEITVNENNYQYRIHVSPEDIGKIIGKGGKIIQSIRNISKVLAVKSNNIVRIDIAET